MEKSKEAAAESEAQSDRSLRLKGKGSVIELELFQCVTEIAVLCAVRRIYTLIYHGVYLTVAGESFIAGISRIGNGVAHLCVADRFD